MAVTPDFLSAHFTMSAENPFRLTPPSEQALYFIDGNNSAKVINVDGSVSTVYHDPSPRQTAGQEGGQANEHVSYPDPSYDAVISAIKNAAKQRTKQGAAYLSLVNSELMLVKKSLFISVFAALAAFITGIVCWLLVNVAMGGALYYFNIDIIAIGSILLCVNIGLCLLFYRTAQKAFHLVSFKRLIALLERTLSN
jgi:hypothetical protein